MNIRRCIALAGLAVLALAPAAAAQSVGVPVTGDAPSTLSLTLGPVPTLGTFVPGQTANYATTVAITTTSTAASSLLTIADLTGIAPTGHLVNGTYSLPSAVQASATSTAAGAIGSPLADVSATPMTIVNYTQPFANDSVTLGLSQHIGSTDVLRTGTYSKTLTLTLSTTSP